jgi:hypothetical protein
MPHTLFSDLATRHAGGLIFQEAHFELLNTPRADLLGYVEPAKVAPTNRAGTQADEGASAQTWQILMAGPLGGVPLLYRYGPLGLQDPIDHRQQRPQLRLRYRLRPRVGGEVFLRTGVSVS